MFASEVLSALPRPTIPFVIPPTVPVNVGEAKSAFKFKEASTELRFAFKSRADCVAVEIGLFASEVLSALPRPTIPFVIPPTVPVKVGEAKSAFKFKEASTELRFAFKSKADCVAVEIGLFASEVLSALPRPTILFVIPPTVPVKVGLSMGAFNPIEFDTVVEKLASLPRANASSFNVSRVAGALATRFATAVFTNSVVAI